MGILPISKLIISMSIPMMVSMLIQALYNIVDGIYVSLLGENALTAVSLAFPVQNLMIAVATGTGVGINSLLSRSLGEKNKDRVDKTAINGIFLAFVSAILFFLFGIFFVRKFFESQTNIKEIIDYGSDYLSIVSIFSFMALGQITFGRLLQSTGKTLYSMISQAFGAIVNIILDPIMIFGYFGFPRLEVAGAAIATVIGQFMGMALAIIFNITLNKEITFRLKGFRPNGEIIRRIYTVGIPTIIMISIGSLMIFSVNRILLSFTPTATAVFGVYFKLQGFIFMPIFGLNNGLVPIVSYNYGARKKQRIIKAIKLSITYAVSIMLAGLAIFQLFPGKLLLLFNASPDMMEIGVPALRIISLSFIFAGFCIVSTSIFQGLGSGIPSMTVSLARQLFALLPLTYLLSSIGGLSMVWWAFPLAETVAVILTGIFLKYFYDNRIRIIE
ncbi:MAG: MATE family efflux transporter [Bacillota bacterium]